MNLDGAAAAALLDAFQAFPEWQPGCASGSSARASTSTAKSAAPWAARPPSSTTPATRARAAPRWDEAALAAVFPALQRIPVAAGVLPGCSFLHFGSTREIVSTGVALATEGPPAAAGHHGSLREQRDRRGGGIAGRKPGWKAAAWRRRSRSPGRNVVTGVDVTAPLALPKAPASTLVRRPARAGSSSATASTTASRTPASAAARSPNGWRRRRRPGMCGAPGEEQILWNARVFPAESEHEGFRRWLWMYAPETATADRSAPGSPPDGIAPPRSRSWPDQEDFHERRAAIRAAEIRQSLNRMFAAGQFVFRRGPGLRPAPRRRPRGVGGRRPGARPGA